MWNKEDLEGFMIESQNNVGQVKYGQELANLIYRLASDNTNKVMVDIGTWNGLGSTRMFIEGMLNNKGSILYTIENNTEKINFAKNYWNLFLKQNNLNVEFVNGSLVSNEEIDNFLNEEGIELDDTNKYWLLIDKTNTTNVVKLPCNKIDVLLIDGSEYSGFLEFSLLKDISNHILLDDVNNLKNKKTREYLIKSQDFILVNEDLTARNGFSYFKKIKK